jgi:hypothetical protein
MRDNHSTRGPRGMLPKLYHADCSIFVWVTLSLKKVDFNGLFSRESNQQEVTAIKFLQHSSWTQ